MKSRGITNLSTSLLIPHPENPRKDIGDLTEMTESVRKNGILQNLTVIPKDKDGNDCAATDNPAKYMVIIGHRRLAAAKAAGVDSIPCRIVEGMSHDEQLLTMLEENMQRSDLTVYDQAQGFQMMLDLGQTVEDIEKKSGFARSTIYHRLNIAKLDKEELKKKTEDPCFQLGILDLAELEKVKSIDKRNEILRKSSSSQNLRYMAKEAAREEEVNEGFTVIINHLKSLGVKELPKDIHSWDCDSVYTIPYKDYDLEDIELCDDGEYYYSKMYERITILTPRSNKKKEKAAPKVKTPMELAYDKMIEAREALKEDMKRFKEARVRVLKDIALKKLEPECKEDIAGRALWQAFLVIGPEGSIEQMADNWIELTGMDIDALADSPEEAEDIYEGTKTDILSWPMARQVALLLSDAWLHNPVDEYNCKPYEEYELEWTTLDTALRNYGFIPSAEDAALLDGSSELIKAAAEASEAYDKEKHK